VDEFGKKRDGLRGECKDCRRLYYLANAEIIKEKSRRWYKNNIERGRVTRRSYGEKNKEHLAQYHLEWRTINKESVAAQQARWVRNNPLKANERKRRRDARKRDQLGSMPKNGYQVILDLFGSCCLACGTSENIAIDHIIPLAKGGLHDISNLQPLCQSCNSKKGVQTIDYRKVDFAW
jgi:5-methylcytosine-specific restriction endonuclease McrA